jgi:hypothetical protein
VKSKPISFRQLTKSLTLHISPVAISATQIKVSWSDNSTNETAFYLERSLTQL